MVWVDAHDLITQSSAVAVSRSRAPTFSVLKTKEYDFFKLDTSDRPVEIVIPGGTGAPVLELNK